MEEIEFTMRRLVLSEYRLVYYGLVIVVVLYYSTSLSLTLSYSRSIKLFFSSFFSLLVFFLRRRLRVLLYGLSEKLLNDAMPARKICVLVAVMVVVEDEKREEFFSISFI